MEISEKNTTLSWDITVSWLPLEMGLLRGDFDLSWI